MRDPASFAAVIAPCWSRRTASLYTEQEPARGQCSVTALVAQDLLGGDLLKTRVGEAWHFYNRIGGRRFDFTSGQFERAIVYDDVPASREEAFADTTEERYEALRRAVDGHA